MVTFDPLPRAVLTPDDNTVCLTPIEAKIELLAQWGLDLLVIIPFTQELAQTSARDFVQTLCEHLHMAELWIGWDFALGRGRTGNARTLTKLGKMMGFDVHVIEAVQNGSVVVSSTQIRQLITAGRVHEAAELLGRYHQLKGVVISGEGRGRKLGLPTANLQVSEHCAIPGRGVYAGYVRRGDERYPAVANVGYRPTFGQKEYTIEAHLLDFQGDLYGHEIRLEFVERLRAERRFSSAEALGAQIRKDIARAREIL